MRRLEREPEVTQPDHVLGDTSVEIDQLQSLKLDLT